MDGACQHSLLISRFEKAMLSDSEALCKEITSSLAWSLPMKKVLLSVAGADGQKEFKDVQVLPGTQPRDVLDKLGLKGFNLSNPKGGIFALNDDLYAAVNDGQKIHATKGDVTSGR